MYDKYSSWLHFQIVNHLFAQEQSDGLGLDLVAMNIQRGRDHGLPGYVEYRKICNVGSASSFNDLSSNISPKVLDYILECLAFGIANFIYILEHTTFEKSLPKC